jgi:Flp pilus assembly protein TadD
MPWGTGWVLGGGNKKRALAVMQQSADVGDDFYANAEALFGLWDMQVREKNFNAALVPARRLAELFPENPEIARFIAARGQAAGR